MLESKYWAIRSISCLMRITHTLLFASDHEYRNITFIDAPTLHAHFSPFYQVLEKKALNKPLNLSLAMKTKLNKAELKQIEYWKPESIGQIIFNYWD